MWTLKLDGSSLTLILNVLRLQFFIIEHNRNYISTTLSYFIEKWLILIRVLTLIYNLATFYSAKIVTIFNNVTVFNENKFICGMDSTVNSSYC